MEVTQIFEVQRVYMLTYHMKVYLKTCEIINIILNFPDKYIYMDIFFGLLACY